MPTFLAFLAAYTLSQFYRAFLAVIAPELARDIGLGAGDLGMISAAWFAAFALAQFLVGWALDRYGPRRTVSLIMIAAVAGAVLFATAESASACILANALIGLGCSPIYMGALFVIGRTTEHRRFALLSAVLLGLGSCGNLIGATPLAIAADAFGWRVTMLAIAGATAAAVLAVALLVRDPPALSAGSTAGGGFVAGVGAILGLRGLWLLFPITLTSYAILLAERGLWIGPYFAEVHGLAAVPRGNAVLAMAAAMTVGAFAYGLIDRMVGVHKPVVMTGGVVTALLLAALAITPGLDALAASLLLAAIGLAGMSYTSLLAHAKSYLPAHLLGRGIAFANFLFFAGAGVLQPLSGAVVTSLQAGGTEAEQVYATLHLGFALLLAMSLAIYGLAERR